MSTSRPDDRQRTWAGWLPLCANSEAGIRVDDLEEGLPFSTSAEALAGVKTLNLRTPFGDIDLTFEPDGTEGFPDLVGRAEAHTVGSVRILVAALADVIRSKTAAGRQKDLLALPDLHEIARRNAAKGSA